MDRPLVRTQWYEPADKTLARLQGVASRGNDLLRRLGMTSNIDEVALLGNEFYFQRWLDKVGREPGLTYFNSAKDDVVTSPLPSNYQVRYWFFGTARGFRVEMMEVTGGHSPLHALYPRLPSGDSDRSGAPVVHASFKCADLTEYAQVQEILKREGYECAQRCVSTYGCFSYWTGLGDDLVWLKPRVNTRDKS
jgi:hypothetical protein